MRFAVLVGIGGVLGCGRPARSIDDAPGAADAARVDALALDAPAEASIDAAPDAPDDSPACTTAPALLLDTSPRVIGSFAMAGGVLYVGAYDQDPNTGAISSPEVLAIDPSTGMPVASPLVTTGAPLVAAAGGAAYATEARSGGSIWRLVPGQAPAEIVTNRPNPGAVTADDTYVYWAEQGAMPADPDVVQRAPLAGGAIETVLGACTSPLDLIIDGGNLYCPEFSAGRIVRIAADGSGSAFGITASGSGSAYPIVSTIADGGHLDYVNLYPNAELWDAPEPSGPATLVRESPGVARYRGLAATATYFYIIDQEVGLVRIRRSDHAIETLYAALGLDADPIIAGGQLYFLADDPSQAGERFVMHCVD